MAVDIKAEFDCVVNELMYPQDVDVQEGDVVLTLEVMKMIFSRRAPCAGKVRYMLPTGSYAQEGQILARIS